MDAADELPCAVAASTTPLLRQRFDAAAARHGWSRARLAELTGTAAAAGMGFSSPGTDKFTAPSAAVTLRTMKRRSRLQGGPQQPSTPIQEAWSTPAGASPPGASSSMCCEVDVLPELLGGCSTPPAVAASVIVAALNPPRANSAAILDPNAADLLGATAAGTENRPPSHAKLGAASTSLARGGNSRLSVDSDAHRGRASQGPGAVGPKASGGSRRRSTRVSSCMSPLFEQGQPQPEAPQTPVRSFAPVVSDGEDSSPIAAPRTGRLLRRLAPAADSPGSSVPSDDNGSPARVALRGGRGLRAGRVESSGGSSSGSKGDGAAQQSDGSDDEVVVVTKPRTRPLAARVASPSSSVDDEKDSGPVSRPVQAAKGGRKAAVPSPRSSDQEGSDSDDDGFIVDDDDESASGDQTSDGSGDDRDGRTSCDSSGSDSGDAAEPARRTDPRGGPSDGGKSKALASQAHDRGLLGLKDGDIHPVTGRIAFVEELHPGGGGAGASSSQGVPPIIRMKAKRDALTAALFGEYNRVVFKGALPRDMPIAWSSRLRKTAGMTYSSLQRPGAAAEPDAAGAEPGGIGAVHVARIELSVKVLDSPCKLACTLLHELCHAAAWVVDRNRKPPHGAVFKKWAAAASRAYPARAVTVCHSYEIAFKFNYACTGPGGVAGCGAQWGRHSRSIDPDRQRCGKCGGMITLEAPKSVIRGGGEPGAPSTPGARAGAAGARTPSEYQRFMSAHRRSTAASLGVAATPQQVMTAVAGKWREAKARGPGGAASSLAAAALPEDGDEAVSIASPPAPRLAASSLVVVDLTRDLEGLTVEGGE